MKLNTSILTSVIFSKGEQLPYIHTDGKSVQVACTVKCSYNHLCNKSVVCGSSSDLT